MGQGQEPAPQSAQSPTENTRLPGFAYEWSAKRNTRTGQIENEIITVRGLSAQRFFASVAEARAWIKTLPATGGTATGEATAPEKCPQCGGTEFYDNTGDEKPNWRCKNKKCGHKILVTESAEGQGTLPGVD